MNYISGEESHWKDPCCKDPCHKEPHHDKKRHYPRQKYVGLNSSSGGAGPFPAIALLATPVNVVSVSINTRERGENEEYWDPDSVRILLQFTAIINIPLGITTTMNFQLVRTTRETTTPIGPVFAFNLTTIATAVAQSFTCQYYDAPLEEANYTYTVQIAAGAVIGLGTSITNATLTGIATEYGV